MTLKRFALLAVLVFVGVASWQMMAALSSDALGMAVGLVFGMLAGIPTALLVLATGKRQERRMSTGPGHDQQQPYQNGRGALAYPQQPPIIVLTGGGVQPGALNQPHHGGGQWAPRPQRQFQVVGDGEGIEDW